MRPLFPGPAALPGHHAPSHVQSCGWPLAEAAEKGAEAALASPTTSQCLACIAEPVLQDLTAPVSLNKGDLEDLYKIRIQELEEAVTLEVKHPDGRPEIVYEDPVYRGKHPRMLVSVDGVHAMHNAIAVLSRKVDNLVLTLEACRTAYYKELVQLREQLQEQALANAQGREYQVRNTMLFEIRQFDIRSKDEMERKLQDITKDFQQQLKIQKDEAKRLEKRLLISERESKRHLPSRSKEGGDPREQISALLQMVNVDTLIRTTRQAVGEEHEASFWDAVEDVVGDHRGIRISELVQEISAEQKRRQQAELALTKAEDVRDLEKRLAMAQQEIEAERDRKAKAEMDRTEAATKLEAAVSGSIELSKQQVAWTNERSRLARELEELRQEQEKLRKENEALGSMLKEKPMRSEGDITPEHVLRVATAKFTCEQRQRLAASLFKLLEQRAQASFLTEALSSAKEEVSTAVAMQMQSWGVERLPSRQRAALLCCLVDGVLEEDLQPFVPLLPDYAKKALVVEAVNTLASLECGASEATAALARLQGPSVGAAPAQDKDLLVSSSATGPAGQLLFDPGRDLSRTAQQALTFRLIRSFKGDEIKALVDKLGERGRKAFLMSIFEDQDPDDLSKCAAMLTADVSLQAFASGLSEFSREKLGAMLLSRLGPEAQTRIVAGPTVTAPGMPRRALGAARTFGHPGTSTEPENRELDHRGVQTDVTGAMVQPQTGKRASARMSALVSRAAASRSRKAHIESEGQQSPDEQSPGDRAAAREAAAKPTPAMWSSPLRQSATGGGSATMSLEMSSAASTLKAALEKQPPDLDGLRKAIAIAIDAGLGSEDLEEEEEEGSQAEAAECEGAKDFASEEGSGALGGDAPATLPPGAAEAPEVEAAGRGRMPARAAVEGGTACPTTVEAAAPRQARAGTKRAGGSGGGYSGEGTGGEGSGEGSGGEGSGEGSGGEGAGGGREAARPNSALGLEGFWASGKLLAADAELGNRTGEFPRRRMPVATMDATAQTVLAVVAADFVGGQPKYQFVLNSDSAVDLSNNIRMDFFRLAWDFLTSIAPQAIQRYSGMMGRGPGNLAAEAIDPRHGQLAGTSPGAGHLKDSGALSPESPGGFDFPAELAGAEARSMGAVQVAAQEASKGLVSTLGGPASLAGGANVALAHGRSHAAAKGGAFTAVGAESAPGSAATAGSQARGSPAGPLAAAPRPQKPQLLGGDAHASSAAAARAQAGSRTPRSPSRVPELVHGSQGLSVDTARLPAGHAAAAIGVGSTGATTTPLELARPPAARATDAAGTLMDTGGAADYVLANRNGTEGCGSAGPLNAGSDAFGLKAGRTAPLILPLGNRAADAEREDGDVAGDMFAGDASTASARVRPTGDSFLCGQPHRAPSHDALTRWCQESTSAELAMTGCLEAQLGRKPATSVDRHISPAAADASLGGGSRLEVGIKPEGSEDPATASPEAALGTSSGKRVAVVTLVSVPRAPSYRPDHSLNLRAPVSDLVHDPSISNTVLTSITESFARRPEVFSKSSRSASPTLLRPRASSSGGAEREGSARSRGRDGSRGSAGRLRTASPPNRATFAPYSDWPDSQSLGVPGGCTNLASAQAAGRQWPRGRSPAPAQEAQGAYGNSDSSCGRSPEHLKARSSDRCRSAGRSAAEHLAESPPTPPPGRASLMQVRGAQILHTVSGAPRLVSPGRVRDPGEEDNDGTAQVYQHGIPLQASRQCLGPPSPPGPLKGVSSASELLEGGGALAAATPSSSAPLAGAARAGQHHGQVLKGSTVARRRRSPGLRCPARPGPAEAEARGAGVLLEGHAVLPLGAPPAPAALLAAAGLRPGAWEARAGGRSAPGAQEPAQELELASLGAEGSRLLLPPLRGEPQEHASAGEVASPRVAQGVKERAAKGARRQAHSAAEHALKGSQTARGWQEHGLRHERPTLQPPSQPLQPAQPPPLHTCRLAVRQPPPLKAPDGERHEALDAGATFGGRLAGHGSGAFDRLEWLDERARRVSHRRGPMEPVGMLVSRVRAQLERAHGSVTASLAALQEKGGEAEGGLSRRLLEQGLISAGVATEDALVFLQALLRESTSSVANGQQSSSDKAGADQPRLSLEELQGALSPGGLPQRALDAAKLGMSASQLSPVRGRLLLPGHHSWEEAVLEPRVFVGKLANGISHRDARTILQGTARTAEGWPGDTRPTRSDAEE